MRVKAELKGELAGLIADHVPPEVLADVIALQAVVKNYEEHGKLASEDLIANARDVASHVVQEYDNADKLEVLVRGLMRRDPTNSKLLSRIAELVLRNIEEVAAGATAAEELDLDETPNLQAAIAQRAQMLRSPALLNFMSENEGKICVIAAECINAGQRRLITGTGFLVGPDLVLTARHVLCDHIVAGKQNPAQTGKRCAFFDHVEGPPIADPAETTLPSGVRRVHFHPTEWLKQFSDAFPADGTFDAVHEPEIEGLKQNLDVVLIKLAEPIGKHSRRRTGGARRGWITLPTPEIPSLLATDDRIIIPQHPGGHPQQIDFGRFNHRDPTATRIRYNTETEKGTSGAPCFNQGFNLVGMHNARYEVPAKKKLNQAIRFDHIMHLLQNQLDGLSPASKLWSVSESDADPEVIVGRDAFQEWIKSADTDAPRGLGQRAFTVEGVRARCGKSFTTRILRAARRDQPEHIVVMSNEREPVPNGAPDFLRVIGEQLRIAPAELDLMPARPSERLPEGGDGDKIATWLSKDLPEWFARALAQQRVQMIDVQAEARMFVDLLRAKRMKPSADDLELLAKPGPVLEERTSWQRAWIVLDDVSELGISQEVKDLLASLLGTRLSEDALAPELRRLRWVFLGWRPDLLTGLAGENLDQATIEDEEIATCVRALVESLDTGIKVDTVDSAVMSVRFALHAPATKARFDDLNERLRTLQETIGALRSFLLDWLVTA